MPRLIIRFLYSSAFVLTAALAPLTLAHVAWAEAEAPRASSSSAPIHAAAVQITETPGPGSPPLPTRRPARPTLSGRFLPGPGYDENGNVVPGSATAWLTWTPAADAANFRLYRNGALIITLSADIGEYRDALKDCLTPQIYWLVAQNSAGSSLRSRTVVVKGSHNACRPTITFVSTDPTTTTVTVNWSFTVSPLQFALYRDGMRVAYVPGNWGEATFSEEWCSGLAHRFQLSAEYAGRLPVKSGFFTSNVGNRVCYVPPTSTPTPTPTPTPKPTP